MRVSGECGVLRSRLTRCTRLWALPTLRAPPAEEPTRCGWKPIRRAGINRQGY